MKGYINKNEESSSAPDVCVFLPDLNGGGAERVLLTVAQELSNRGFKVDLVLAAAVGPYLDEVKKPMRLIDLQKSRVIAALPSLITYLKKNKPFTLLTGMGRCNLVALWARIFARVNTKIFISEHSNMSAHFTNTLSLRSHIRHWLERYWYSKANGIIAVSKGVAESLANRIGLDRDRINVIYNPVVSKQMIDMSYELIEHEWLMPVHPPVILAVGRLSKEKDYPTLIKAFSLLREQKIIRLLILGDGDERFKLESLVQKLHIKNDVQFLGFIKNPFPYMRQANVLVLSSLWEGFGNVLAEAMALGTPVVSTDCSSGPYEILEGGKWGRLVAVGDAEALSAAILSTLSDTANPDVSYRAKEFSVKKIVDLYQKVLSCDNNN